MFLLGKKQIKIREIERYSVVQPRIRMKPANTKNNDLAFSPIHLHIAIARSILSKDLANSDLLFEACSSFLRFQTIINTSNSDLTLNKCSYESLRDFTKTNRIGELAQGLTYLFAQEHLNYPIVVDFEGFIRSKASNKVKFGKTPDYILLKENNCNISLIESKGTYATKSSSTKGVLRDSLNQCNSGRSIVEKNLNGYIVSKTYGVCAKLQNESDSKTSELQFVSSKFDDSNKKNNIDIIRYHYASWFLLMGNIQIYNKLINGEILSPKDYGNGVTKSIFEEEFKMFKFRHSIPFIFPPNIYSHFNYYGIRSKVLEVLEGSVSCFPIIKLQLNENVDRNYKHEYFNDGTIICEL